MRHLIPLVVGDGAPDALQHDAQHRKFLRTRQLPGGRREGARGPSVAAERVQRAEAQVEARRQQRLRDRQPGMARTCAS